VESAAGPAATSSSHPLIKIPGVETLFGLNRVGS
jgi:hypothetical protein